VAEPPEDRLICRRCGESRRISEFARDRSKTSDRKSICKRCDRLKARRYYQENREAVIARVSARQRLAGTNDPNGQSDG
jgi:hypothetical protein